jgi:pimeloyl-ACP methyl ester carboxylesterase
VISSGSVNHNIVTVFGHRLHTMRTAGSTGFPLLLIMGLGGNCDMWKPLLPHLGDRTVIAFDAPGTGRSSTPAWPVSVPALADIAAAVLEHYEVERADVLGYSYGGAIAQQLAAHHHSRVRRLVLAATTMGAGSVLGSLAAAQELATPLRYYVPGLFEKSAAKVYGGEVGRNADLRAQMASVRAEHPPSPYGYALQLAAGCGWTSRDFATQIEQPTLVLGGDDDPLVPLENVYELGAAIPNTVVRVVVGAGHLMLMDAADQVGPLVRDFLDSPSAHAGCGGANGVITAEEQEGPEQ